MDKNLILKEAQKYLARGQIDKAIIEWEKLVKEAPDGNVYNTVGDLYLKKGDKKSSVDFFHKSASFFREGGFSLKALALYKKVININPSDAGAFTALGELSEEKGLATDAIKYYLTAADILSRDASKEKFLSMYERILSLAPGNIPLREKVAGLFLKEGLSFNALREYIHIAQYCSDKGDYEQARSSFAKILELQPNNKDALLGIISVCGKKGDLKRAIEYVNKAIGTRPDDTDLVLRCALLLKEMGAHDEALGYVEKIIELKPTDAESSRLIGEFYLLKGDREAAWKSYKVVVDSLINENQLDAAIELAREFKDTDPVEIGRFLISLYKQKEDLDSAFEEMRFVAGLLMDSGLEGEAVDLYREALEIRPDDVQIKKVLAEREMAVTGLESPAMEQGRSTEDLLTDAEIFIKYGLYDEAKSILEELRIKEPDNIDVHIKLKSLYVEEGDREQAVTECLILYELYGRGGDTDMQETVFKEAVGINPDDPRLLDRMSAKAEGGGAATSPREAASERFEDYMEDMAEAEFYLRQGLKDDALRIYHNLLRLFPDEAELLQKISSVEGNFLGSGELESIHAPETDIVEAQELQGSEGQPLDTDVLDIFEEFKKGLEKELEEEDFETHYNLGIAYKEMGLIDDAIKEFQTSKNDLKCVARSLTMLGICYLEKGMFPLAIEAFKSSIDNITSRDESYWGVRYDLACAYEGNGDKKEAYQIFSEIYGMDSKFRQVSEKLSNLKAMLPKEEIETKRKDRVSYI
ncbi:MAG TPA: tetratricopeptide repeat protein [Thermodesulfovibrionales bacterium]|nr:tetratricopeptide repeat protein [Thermodesulfovibrionales bacterium]